MDAAHAQGDFHRLLAGDDQEIPASANMGIKLLLRLLRQCTRRILQEDKDPLLENAYPTSPPRAQTMVEIIWCQRQAAPRSCRDDDILVCLIETGTSSIRDCNSISQIFRSNAVQCILQEPKEDTKPLRKRHSSGRGSSHCPATSCAPIPEPHLRPHHQNQQLIQFPPWSRIQKGGLSRFSFFHLSKSKGGIFDFGKARRNKADTGRTGQCTWEPGLGWRDAV